MIGKTLNRRTFIKTGLAIAGSAASSREAWPALFVPQETTGADLASVKGDDAFAAAAKSLELVGAGRLIPKGGRVGILVNAPNWWRLPGSHTSTEVVLAVVRECLNSGAKEIVFLQNPAPAFWGRSGRSASLPDVVKAVKPFSGDMVEKEIKGAVALKKARVAKDLLECDAWIDIPIAKDHAGTRFSGCLKNTMGACANETNQFFHFGSGAKGEYEDVDFLSQCIADLGLVRPPALCVSDVTVVLAENGPAGPGRLLRPQKVVAGKDPVAVDAYTAGLIERDAGDIAMLKKAASQGVGSADLSKLVIMEETL